MATLQMPALVEKPNLQTWDAFDKMFDEAFAPRRVSSPLPEETTFPEPQIPYRPTNPTPHSQPKFAAPQPTYRLEPLNAYEQPRSYPYGKGGKPYSSSQESFVFSSPEPENDPVFEKLWNEATQKATQKVHKSTTTAAPKKPSQPVTSPTITSPTPAAPKLNKRRSRVTFRDSSDGKTVTATFHLPGIPKEDVHISFQPDRLIVTWQTVKVTESQEGDRLVRERREKNYIRTLHLPDGTRFEEVKATMDSRNLLLTYPKMRPSQLVPIT